MTRQPKRRPGEGNPKPDAEAPMRFVRESEMADGHGTYGMGGRTLTNGVIALVAAWRRRRRAQRRR